MLCVDQVETGTALTSAGVARTWLGRVPAERSDEYLAYVQATGARDLRATPGNRSVMVLRRVVGDVAEIQVISTWDALDSIRAFAGDPVDQAQYYPSDPEFLLEMSERVEHWDLYTDPAAD